MKLLIVTQVVDQNHPILGFFHRWIEEFAKHTDSIHVIALEVGEYQLPENVSVHSLGKEDGSGKIERVVQFYKYVWSLRDEYDAVFIHMNPEYVVLAGLLWRVMGKQIALWYTHKKVDLKLRVATIFANTLFTASKESFRLTSNKLHVVGHGIDTDFWKPDSDVHRGTHWLSVGRLMKAKRHDRAIHDASKAQVPLRIIGEGSERSALEALAQKADSSVELLGSLSAKKLRSEYSRAAALIHRSETGSLDKVVLEAAACDCPVDSTDPAIAALPLSREYVSQHHSLQSLIPNIMKKYGL